MTFYHTDYRLRQSTNPIDQKIFAAPSIMLSAFASELMLKSLIILEDQTFPREHDLLSLFLLLRDETKHEIIDQWNEILNVAALQLDAYEKKSGIVIPRELEVCLAKGANIFQHARYFYEYKHIAEGHLGRLPIVLRTIILRRQPDWKNIHKV